MPAINIAENAGLATAVATNPTLNLTPAAGQGAPDLQVSLAASTRRRSGIGRQPQARVRSAVARGGGSRRFRSRRTGCKRKAVEHVGAVRRWRNEPPACLPGAEAGLTSCPLSTNAVRKKPVLVRWGPSLQAT